MRSRRSALPCAIFSRSPGQTVPARLVSQFADSRRVRVLDAPRELGDVQFHPVWHPRLDEDPSHRWLRPVVSTVATPRPHMTAREN
jgi:DNA-binding transcriptional LysR family regulator